MVNDKRYNPTLRLFFCMAHEQDAVSVTLLGGGWKAPLQPLDADCSLIEKHISRGLSEEPVGQTVDPEDFAMMQKIMNDLAPKIYCECSKIANQPNRNIWLDK